MWKSGPKKVNPLDLGGVHGARFLILSPGRSAPTRGTPSAPRLRDPPLFCVSLRHAGVTLGRTVTQLTRARIVQLETVKTGAPAPSACPAWFDLP